METLLDQKSKEKDSTLDPIIQLNLSLELDGYLKSIYFCLLFLGDIARYTELHNLSTKPKNWSVASQYYLRARQVLPSLGNSHNQVSSYHDHLSCYSLCIYLTNFLVPSWLFYALTKQHNLHCLQLLDNIIQQRTAIII